MSVRTRVERTLFMRRQRQPRLGNRRPANWRAAIACGALAVLLAATFVGCGSGTDGPKAGGGGSSATTTKPTPKEDLDPLHPVVELQTSAGTIRLKLDAEKAPSTVANFLNYASAGYYANTLFHYVAPDKMILGGGYSVDVKPKPAGSTVRNEAHNGLKNVRGSVAMARDTSAGIDTATSQFFINLGENTSFDHRGEEADEYGYCVFGEVVDGIEVAEEISRSSTRDEGGDLSNMPVPPVVIKSVRVVE
jgi:cyclophilin family peptidyl-prolyl cis-trans isomerase